MEVLFLTHTNMQVTVTKFARLIWIWKCAIFLSCLRPPNYDSYTDNFH